MGVGVGWDVNVHVTLMMLRCSWGLGWGGMLTFMLRWWCYAARGDWGGVGWDVNVHVTLMMLRCSWGLGVGWDVNVHVTLMMLRCSWGLGWGGMFTHVTLTMLRCSWRLWWGGVGCQRWCYADDVTHLDVLFPWVGWFIVFPWSLGKWW